MASADAKRSGERRRVELDGRAIPYRLVRSDSAQRMRVRVGPAGVEVIQPVGRTDKDADSFLSQHAAWVLLEVDRTERLHRMRREDAAHGGQILFRGEPTAVLVERDHRSRLPGNRVRFDGHTIVVSCGFSSITPAAVSLERWLRREARRDIDRYLLHVTERIGERPGRVYVMGQRTKWGNCSALRNLSFNWRLVMAPEYVFRYLVTHEAVHLVVPDHSAKFWLTVQSLCAETEGARQWLVCHQSQLHADLKLLM